MNELIYKETMVSAIGDKLEPIIYYESLRAP